MADVAPTSTPVPQAETVGDEIDRAIAGAEFYRRSGVEGPRSLIVFCHGMSLLLTNRRPASRTSSFGGLLGRLLREPGDPFARSDFLPFDFENTVLSRKTPREIAADLAERIHEVAGEDRYASIYLVGYSTGSLLVRGAVLTARDAGHPWVGRLERLVLLANSNRGFEVIRSRVPGLGDLSGPIRKVTAFSQFVGLWGLFPRLGLFRISMGAYRDSPWVRDLRLGWLRCFEDPTRHGPFDDAPRSVQLFGTIDQLVGDDDTQEVYLFGRTKVVTLDAFEHPSFLTPPFPEPGLPLAEPFASGYPKIREAFREDVDEIAPPDEPARSSIVFLIHGIRDYADWQENLGYQIRKIAETVRSGDVEVVHVRYGYFNAFQFPFTSQRLRCVRAFVDAYYQARTRFPYIRQADIHVLAHSNGTFVLGEAMLQHREIRFNRVILCGSVLPRSFDWGILHEQGQVLDIHNDCASRDWPVGWLCRGLSIVPGLGLGTAGYAGFEPFHYRCRMFLRNNFLAGDHGAGLRVERHEAVARHLLGDASLLVAGEPPRGGWFDVAHRLCVLAIPALLLIAALARPGPPGWVALAASATTLLVVYLVSRV